MRWTLLAVTVVGVVLLVAEDRPSAGAVRPRVELVDGSLSQQNSLEGQAVFGAENIGPGDSASGSVTVSNAGTLAGDLTLSGTELSDTPGPGGEPLSEQLQLLVQDVTSGSPATVYLGRLDGMRTLPLGTLGPGAARVFSFTASLPAAGDDSVAGASMSVSYTWTAEGTPPPVAPPPPDSTTDLRQPLRLRVRVPSKQRLVSRGKLVAYARCDQTCWLESEARLTVGRSRALRTRRARTGRVRAGRETRLVLRLPKRSLKTLKRELGKQRRASVRVTVAGRTSAGARSRVEKRARIAPERARR